VCHICATDGLQELHFAPFLLWFHQAIALDVAVATVGVRACIMPLVVMSLCCLPEAQGNKGLFVLGLSLGKVGKFVHGRPSELSWS
jgi:hypothetical protein